MVSALTQSATLLTRHIPVIGVIGGIGSGKSAVAQAVAARANVMVIDADSLGHQALELTAVKSALRQRFGQAIFDERGEIQRSALARKVFGEDVTSQAARRDLERVVHPAIEKLVVDAIEQAEQLKRDAVLLDAAVLIEAGWQGRCDAVVFVDAPEEVRRRRVATRSGWSMDELRRRESSQLSLVEKRQHSNLTISNESDDDRAAEQLLEFLCRSWGVGCKPLSNGSQQS